MNTRTETKSLDVVTIVGGQPAVLCHEKALWLPAMGTIIVSDLHFGKAAHFRKHGLAMPSQMDEANIAKLEGLLARTLAQHLVFSGDAFHSEANLALERFRAWRHSLPHITFRLVRGNHDILSSAWYVALGMAVVEGSLELGNIAICHDPADAVPTEDLYFLAGHVHPAVRLQGAGRQSLALPCFLFGKSQGLLPAFGAFTGNHIVRPTPADRVWVCTGERVLAVR